MNVNNSNSHQPHSDIVGYRCGGVVQAKVGKKQKLVKRNILKVTSFLQ
jgi:hypothetical protein